MDLNEHLTSSQLEALSIIERVCSVLSLLGSLFVIGTFIASKSFHKPINRLVFYASFGNMMTNVGTLMSRQYIHATDSVGCQFQGFLIQMFMPADAFWTLAMAINVYLTFYFKYDARALRRMEIPYLIACYGVPFIPAFVYIFVKNDQGHRVYGDATLWCWVAPEWDIWRIATFYGPIWVVIIITFFIYIRCGQTIYRKRKELKYFNSSDNDVTNAGDAITTLKTTEVLVTSEVLDHSKNVPMQPLSRPGTNGRSAPQNEAYSVTISADAHPSEIADVSVSVESQTSNEPVQGGGLRRQNTIVNPLRREHRRNNAAWSYTKCSILFFTAILITWIPSSANRVYSVLHTKSSSIPLEFMSATVLPLQGFWNAVIYTVTSWNAVKNFATDLRMGRRPDVTELVGGMTNDEHTTDAHRRNISGFRTVTRSGKPSYETESTTELAGSRPTSDVGQAV